MYTQLFCPLRIALWFSFGITHLSCTSNRIYLVSILALRCDPEMSNDSIVLHPPNHSDWLRDGHITQVRPMSVKPRLFLAILEEYFSTPYTPTPMFTSKGPQKQETSLLFAKSCLTMKSTQQSKAKKWKERDQSFISHWASGSSHAWILNTSSWWCSKPSSYPQGLVVELRSHKYV